MQLIQILLVHFWFTLSLAFIHLLVTFLPVFIHFSFTFWFHGSLTAFFFLIIINPKHHLVGLQTISLISQQNVSLVPGNQPKDCIYLHWKKFYKVTLLARFQLAQNIFITNFNWNWKEKVWQFWNLQRGCKLWKYY